MYLLKLLNENHPIKLIRELLIMKIFILTSILPFNLNILDKSL